jgi:hypothetical protein
MTGMRKSGLLRRVATIVIGVVVVCGMLGVAFAIGLHAGTRRNALFQLVKDVKVTIESALGRPDATSAANDKSRHASMLDAAGIANAQSQHAPPADAADWSGFYRLVTAEKDLAGFRPINPWLPNAIAPRLQPWARAKMEATDGVADDTGQICQPVGMLRLTGFAGGFLWLPAADKILIAYSPIELGGVQRVYLNRTHPRNLLPTWNGDSVGYWEGDTLVVDTVGFNDKSWLHSTMEPHTEELHVVQRVRRVGNGAFLEVHYTVEDRKALTSAYVYSRYYKRVDDHMPEEICNDDVQMFREFRDQALKAQLDRARRIE